MRRRLQADKDTYITNRVVSNQRVTDANVGQAGTLDLFKLFDETSLSDSTGTIELTRILVHFDLDPLRALTGSILNIDSPSFKATLNLVDVFGGQTLPSNFTVAAFPLSQSFDEGVGRDISQFRDLDAANFITASVSAGSPIPWFVTGANAQGLLGSADIDIISSGNVGSGVEDLFSTQLFESGEEDLAIDVTTVVSATLAGLIPDHGFRVSFSGTQETDEKSRFVKRFGARHATDPLIRPHLDVQFDDSIQDDHRNMFFGLSGSLFFNNFHFGQPANIIFNSTEITGADSIIVRLVSGSGSTFFEKIITGSQHQVGSNFVIGVYSASFAIAADETGSLLNESRAAGSATFTEIWQSLDGTVGYFTGSLVINNIPRTAFDGVSDDRIIAVTNNRGEYQSTERVRFRIYVQNPLERIISSKLPLERKSEIHRNLYYQIRDINSKRIVIPFDKDTSSTRLSTDSDGMFFDLFMSDLEPGLVYSIELQIDDMGSTRTYDFSKVRASFRVNT